ncbi:RNA-binding domain-containing protein [Corynebacterium lubricantis]|uniref:RNA-binding domain-containing protein n=1 Tax=Corynebacterium lubricantis TaxID=541095 RepID=UPI0012EA55EC|nr:RNA-binding domain-containing protein [Corynebacterium lubricantis]
MRSDEMLDTIRRGQGISIAFARRTSSAYINERGVIELLACMANGEGGTLFIGVNQNGSISGCYPFHGDSTSPRELEATIRQYTSPSLSTSVSVEQIDGKDVVAISVEESRTPIATTWGVYRSRRLNSQGTAECFGMDPTYLFTRYRDANAVDWARIPVPGLSMSDLAPEAFDTARVLVSETNADPIIASLSDDDLLRSLGYRNDSIEPMTYGAVLLFGTREALQHHLPSHQLVVADVAGTKRTSRSQAPLAVMLADLHKRREKLDPPVTELIINALAHRDYFLPGPVYVYGDQKRTTVTSPGGLPRGLTPQIVCSSTASYAPRSLSLSTALARLGVTDGAGLGLGAVSKYQIEHGFGTLTWAGTHERAVTVTARKELLHPELPGLVAAASRELSLNQLIVLDAWQEEPDAQVSDLAAKTGLQDDEVHGVVDTLRVLGLSPRDTVPVHTTQGAPRGNEEKVVALVASRGDVTSGEVADALDLSQQQAYRVLKKLVDAGRLSKVGNTRTSRYRFN